MSRSPSTTVIISCIILYCTVLFKLKWACIKLRHHTQANEIEQKCTVHKIKYNAHLHFSDSITEYNMQIYFKNKMMFTNGETSVFKLCSMMDPISIATGNIFTLNTDHVVTIYCSLFNNWLQLYIPMIFVWNAMQTNSSLGYHNFLYTKHKSDCAKAG